MSTANNPKDEPVSQSWLEFSQTRPNANMYLHQAAAMLHSMDEAFRCSLCRNIFTNPVSVQPCHHAFCNDCIHKALRCEEAPQGVVLRCPYCRHRLDDSIDLAQCIVQNRNFEEACRHYKTLRPLLEKALQVPDRKPDAVEPSLVRPALVRPALVRPALVETRAVVPVAVESQQQPQQQQQQQQQTVAKTPKQERLSVEGNSNINEDGIKHRKLRNPFIREQFSIEFNEAKETWCFLCTHCGQVALRSKNKTWNASILTEHICLKCPSATEEVKQRAAEFTRVKTAPNYSGRYSSSNKKQKRSGNHEEQEDKDQEDGGGADDSSAETYS